jgi:(4-(4-[2-(gamma-L-glutamylamino)ethyl]phenoxymethyl)furan-2-yl)methanamine synthase
MMRVIGWDIGAVNVKALLWAGPARQSQVAVQPFEIWRERGRLREILQLALNSVSMGTMPDAMAVTMTAELSDTFETKREGVLFVLDTLTDCFPGVDIQVFSLSGHFVPIGKARAHPLDFAASNWLASAIWIARQISDCLFIDVGSTTTDILPIVEGKVCVSGRSDLDRLSSGELVYTGALRTNLAAIVQTIPIGNKICRVASEYFSVSGDVHLILGNLDPANYTCPTPDGRPPSVDSARARLARLVCADIEMLSIVEIDGIASHVYAQQVRQIRESLEQILSRHPGLRSRPAIISGSGSFLGRAAAQSAGLIIGHPAGNPGQKELAVMPCFAVAQLLAEYLRSQSR